MVVAVVMAANVGATPKLTCKIVNQFSNAADVLVTGGPPESEGLRISVDKFGVLTTRSIKNYIT